MASYKNSHNKELSKQPKPINDFINIIEESVIGICFVDVDNISLVSEKVNADYFSEKKNKHLIESVFSLYWRDEDITIFSVARDLEQKGFLSEVGGLAEIERIRLSGEESLTETSPRLLTSTLKDFYIKREVTNIIDENKEAFLPDSENTIKEALEIFQSKLSDKLLEVSEIEETASAANYMPNYVETLEKRREIAEKNKELSGGLQGIPTPLESLNRYTSGLMPGQLITIGAQTGVGKSVFAVMQAVAALKANMSVMFFSLEMSAEELFDRIVANLSHVKLSNIKEGNLSEEEKDRINKAVKFLETKSLIIETDPRATVDSIRSKATKQQQTEQGLDLVIVDYLQLVSSSERFNSRQELVADLSRNMKLTAKSLGIPIMTLTQLNRQKSESEDGFPTLDNIRESGAIAQDSDIVLLLHRNKDTENVNEKTYVILSKNRNGESDKRIHCYTELAYSNFREVKKEDKDKQNINSHNPSNKEQTNDTNNKMKEFFDSDDDSWDELEEEDYEDNIFDDF